MNDSAAAARRGLWQMVLCASMWSIAGVFIKQIPWNAMVLAGLRSAIAAAVLGIYMLATRRRLAFNRQSLLVAACLCFTSFCFMGANKLTTAANAIVLQYTAPVFLLVYGAVFEKKRFRRGDVLAVGLTTAGIALFFLDQLAPGAVVGNVLGIASGMGFAALMIASAGAQGETRMSGLLQGHMLTALLGIPFLFVYGAEGSVRAILSLVILGVFQLGLPYILYAFAIEKCSPLACLLLAALEPILNPVWVFLVTGEAPGLTALWGGALVIVSVTAWCVWDHRAGGAKSEETLAA